MNKFGHSNAELPEAPPTSMKKAVQQPSHVPQNNIPSCRPQHQRFHPDARNSISPYTYDNKKHQAEPVHHSTVQLAAASQLLLPQNGKGMELVTRKANFNSGH